MPDEQWQPPTPGTPRYNAALRKAAKVLRDGAGLDSRTITYTIAAVDEKVRRRCRKRK
jgi:hypothetical protein